MQQSDSEEDFAVTTRSSQLLHPDNWVAKLSIWFKRAWILAVSLLLGPFAIWFALLGKWGRRGQIQDAIKWQALLFVSMVGFFTALFFLPLPHMVLVSLYLISILISNFGLYRVKAWQWFHFSTTPDAEGIESAKRSLSQSLAAAALALLPCFYVAGLFSNLIELQAFSIRLPGSVYTDSLLWVVWALPATLVLGVLLWRSTLHTTPRTLLFLFVGVLALTFWVVLFDWISKHALEAFVNHGVEPLIFSGFTEGRIRLASRVFFYCLGGLLAIDWLLLSGSWNAFLRRSFFIALPSGLGFLNLIFLLGDMNPWLEGMANIALREERPQVYSSLAGLYVKRVPNSFRTPFILETLGELKWQQGDHKGAQNEWQRLAERANKKPYAAFLGQRGDHYLMNLQKNREKKNSKEVDSALIQLALPSIRPAIYLDGDWYALLSGIGYLHPEWSDLELKKRLLTVSPSLQMDLPAINGVPSLRPILSRLGIPHRLCFADGFKLREALRRGLIPLVNQDGIWTPVAGYDPRRDAYEIIRYPQNYERNPWWGGQELDLQELNIEAKGIRSQIVLLDTSRLLIPKKSASISPLEPKWQPIRKALPAYELERDLHDVGGVALILGDSNWISDNEDRAAFLAELGDGYYQEQENDEAAAQSYAQAQLLFPSDYISARMLYLKRRWLHHHQDPSDYTHLFESQLEPKWFSYLSLNKKDEEKRVSDILAGKLGQYLLMNWVGPIPPEGTSGYESALDTAWNAFLQLRKLQPAQGLFLDSLAALAHQKKLWDLESAYLDTLSGFNPFGDQDIQYRRANSLFLGGHYAEAKKSLKRCESFQHEARWLLIKAAALCSEGNIHKGRKILEQSLKLDKTNHEAFLWWKKCSSESEQSTDSLWVKRWEIRTQ